MATKKLPPPKRPPGRTSTYTIEIADIIIERLSDGIPLAEICREHGMPAVSTVSDWRTAHPDFAVRFARAREDGFDQIAMDALRISDTPVEAIIEKSTANGLEVTRQDALGHRKLQVETRLKLLAKWDPKRYGDRVAIGGADDMPAIKTDSHVTLDPSDAYKALLGGG